ncbi:MAG: DUF4276 family protein [Acidobacteria bacterium]|nr:DUF4276 family protein [Acidobacteriota bacterium]
MKELRIAPLVEGDGEVNALPILLRRIAFDIDPSVSLKHVKPFRHPAGRLIKPEGLERALNAVAITHPHHAILVLIDSEDDCPATLGPHLLHRATTARPDLLISTVLAYREFETWFLAAAESLSGVRGLPSNLIPPPDPEAIRDAKGWLTKQMPSGTCYSLST